MLKPTTTLDKKTDLTLGKLLSSLKSDSSTLDNVQTAVVRDAQRSYIKNTALPKELVQKMAQLQWIPRHRHNTHANEEIQSYNRAKFRWTR